MLDLLLDVLSAVCDGLWVAGCGENRDSAWFPATVVLTVVVVSVGLIAWIVGIFAS